MASVRAKRIREAPPPPPLARPKLLDFATELIEGFERPEWLAPYADLLEHACSPKPAFIGSKPPPGYGALRVALHSPPQHGKTTLTLVAFIWWAKFFPGMRHAYVTYSVQRTLTVAKDFRKLAEQAGFIVTGTLHQVILNGTTTILFTSIGSTLTGYPLDGVCIIDDPLDGVEDARSRAKREQTHRFWRSNARQRRHPGTSFIVMATRWHEDDMSGHLVKNYGFAYVCLRCEAEAENDNDVSPDGRIKSDPLHRFPGEWLWPTRAENMGYFAEEKAKDPYDWAANYQGYPRPRDGTLFKRVGEQLIDGTIAGPGFYQKLPDKTRKIAFGIDLAFTRKTNRDWSICILGYVDGDGLVYIVNVIRKHCTADDFAAILKEQRGVARGAPMRWYTGHGETGVAQLMRRLGVTGIKPMGAKVNKFTRAIPASTAWNRGRILLPDPDVIQASWFDAFMDAVCSFTGEEDEHDDDVDALAALFDELTGTAYMQSVLRKKKVA